MGLLSSASTHRFSVYIHQVANAAYKYLNVAGVAAAPYRYLRLAERTDALSLIQSIDIVIDINIMLLFPDTQCVFWSAVEHGTCSKRVHTHPHP